MTLEELISVVFRFVFDNVAPLILWIVIFVIVDIMMYRVSTLVGIREINKITQALVYGNDSVITTFYVKSRIPNANMIITFELGG